DLAKDPANAAPILQELLLVVSNHDDPQLHTPHGLLTLEAGRDLLRLTRPPGGLGLLRFLVLYNFSLQKRALTPAAVDAAARAIPAASSADMERAYRKVVHDHMGSKAGALLARIGLEDWEFDRVEEILQALAFEGQAETAYRPLLIAASAEPGFLGHTLSEVHAARLASRYLTPSENAWLLWKMHRTLTTKFGYPDFLRLGRPELNDRASPLAALESSLRYKSPPAEETVRHALEAEVPLDDILAAIVDFYGQWTVGEKEHTIGYLNAVLQTAKFLGKEEALLPLAIGLSKLPF